MSASFVPSSRSTSSIGAPSYSPPSLTTSSSPTSSDSTGDEELQSATRKRSANRTAGHTVSASVDSNKAGFQHSLNNVGFSPSIWSEESHPPLLSGINNTALQSLDKASLENMTFGAWDGAFANLAVPSNGDMSMDMDLTASTDYAFSPSSVQSPASTSSHNAAASLSGAALALSQDSPSGSDRKTGFVSTAPSTIASNQSFAGSGEDSDENWNGKTKDNDEAMFDSFVQAGSFAPSFSNGDSAPKSHFASMNVPANQSSTMLPPASLSKSTSPSAKATDGVFSTASSRRNSGESSEPRKQAGSSSARRFGSQTAVHSNNLDADLGYSALDVAHPSREGLKDLQVHIHGVPMQGAKSRVETQIRMRIELVRPKPSSTGGWERIGSFTHIKLPPLSGTKRKSKKYQKTDVPPEKTLFVDATVVNATPPHDRVFVCKGCRQRERKRAHRKKDPKVPMDLQPTEEEIKSLGIDPSASDAVERTQARMEEEEKKRVVLFNCGDYVDFEEGEAVLPTRITCYCRHHKEKVGFCVIFTMRDWQGRLIATGSTPPIMITDDHKSMGIAAQAAQLAASSNTAQSHGVVKQVNGTSPRSQTEDNSGQVSASGSTTPSGIANGDGAPRQQRKERSKPYDDSRRRRNTATKELNMTPYGTGQNTPSVSATSPPPSAANNTNGVDFSSADFWSAFAVGSNAMDGLGRSNSTSTGIKTPGEASSIRSSPAPAASMLAAAPQSQLTQSVSPALQAHLAQGSLSPTTLQTNLQSLPNFDLEEFFRNAQAGVSNGVDFAQLMAMAAAAALPAHLRQPSSAGVAPPLSMGSFSQTGSPAPSGAEQANAPKISKLIPGEGPTSGGIEVTILGENFTEGISCVFGDVPASNTKVWASNTLVCILPPSSSPGPVVVSLKCLHNAVQPSSANGPLQLFTYVDTTDRALMELALQVVGLQMTGQMRSAREVAMRVVGTGGGQSGLPTSLPSSSGTQGAREAVAGLFTARGQSSNFQDSVVQFLSLLDTDVANAEGRSDAIRLANKQGHTLLHLATMMGFHRLVEFLIRRGCPLDARDRNGATALHFAAIQGRVAIARLLLRSGARDDVGDANGLYAIDLAREQDQVDLEMILDNTSRTGHWQTRRLTSHTASRVPYDDQDELLSDDVSSDASLSDVDDDNVSTSCDDYSEDSLSLMGECDSESEDASEEQEARQAVSDLPDPLIDEKTHLKALETAAVEESSRLSSKEQEAALDVAVTKSWLTKAGDTGVDWMNRKLLPQTVTDRFAHLHLPTMPQIPQMPAISVFHLAAPSMPSMPWYGSPRRAEDSNDKDEVKSAEEHGWEQFERGRLQTLWRSIVEEGAWVLNPLYSPPPAYESVAVANETDPDDGNTKAAVTDDASFCSPSTSECATPVAGPSRRSSTKRRPTASECGLATSRPSSASSTTKPRSAPVPSANCTVTRRRPAPRTLRDDAMLVWFWIPVLLVVGILLLFSKSSSILSYADLMSYLDLNLPAVGKIREVAE